MRRWFDLIVEAADDLGAILTAEQGKPFAEARGEILFGAAFIEWFAEEAKRVYGETIPPNVADRRLFVLKQPIGVCAAITPWNFPMAMIPRKAGPALAAGLHDGARSRRARRRSRRSRWPSSPTARAAGGRLHVVPGSASVVGDELATNPTVRKLTFTGSTEVGKQLMAKCAGTVKKVSLELGGNAPLIVFDDADLDARRRGRDRLEVPQHGPDVRLREPDPRAGRDLRRVRREVLGGGRARCASGNGFERGRRARAADRRGGGGEGRGARRRRARRRRDRHGRRRPARARRHVLRADRARGRDAEMKIAREETFGPVAPVFRFSTEEEAIELANATEFGLAAYFFAGDVARVWRVGEAARVRHRRRQHRRLLLRGRAVRRLQGVRHRPRGLAPRDRRVPRDQVPVPRSGPAGAAELTSEPRRPEGGRGSTFVQSLDRGLAVIRTFERGSAATPSEVAAATGLTRAAARRFLLTLADLGYVRAEGRAFRLSPRVLELGRAYLSGLTLPDARAAAPARARGERARVVVASPCSTGSGSSTSRMSRRSGCWRSR